MKIDLDGINLEEVVQQATMGAITKTLGATLPRVVEKLLTERATYGKTNVIQDAFVAAVKVEVDANVKAFIDERAGEIKRLVRAKMELEFQPSTIAEAVITNLAGIKTTVYPFKKGKVATPSIDEDLELDELE